MIKRLIRRVLGLPSEVRVPRGQHDLTRDAISPATAKVCAALREAGFSGYVVGGAVRDLLLGITPKDFDVATDARPEQVRPLFRRAIIIGRRFRLVHVMLGPETRYREDPIRMLRAVRLAAKLGLTLDPATREPIREMAPLLERVPPARLFDEMLKLLLSGHASACLRQLREVGLHKGVLPLLDVILEQPLGERFVTLALAQTDERVLTERPVSPAFLFAALLWHEVLAAWKARQARGERTIPALEAAMDDVLDTQCAKLAITRKLTATMREVWAMQPRFEQRSGHRAYRLLEAPRFRMAYDFLALRAASGEVPAEFEAWWRAFQSADPEARKAMLLPDTGPRKRRRRRRKKRPAEAASQPA
jgi:poly(A) polymerase